MSDDPALKQDGRQAKNRKKGGGDEILKIFSSETTRPIQAKLYWNDPWMVPFQNCVRRHRPPTNMAARLKIEKRGDEFQKSSPETIVQILTKLCWNDAWMVFFQNGVRLFRSLAKMAAIAELGITLNLMRNSLKFFFGLEVLAHLIPKFNEMVTRWVP